MIFLKIFNPFRKTKLSTVQLNLTLLSDDTVLSTFHFSRLYVLSGGIKHRIVSYYQSEENNIILFESESNQQLSSLKIINDPTLFIPKYYSKLPNKDDYSV